MFFVIGVFSGVLADDERRQRARVEETAQKLSEVYRQLQASFEQLRRADRLSALGELSAGLAHEIRNPIGSIEGALRILQRLELPEETRQEFGELAQKEVNRLKGLVSDFLDFARPQAPRCKPTDLADLLESVRSLAAETAEMAGVTIRIQTAENLSAISIDREQMKQVLLNLVLNAIQATPGGGEVVLRADKETDSVAIHVQDEGIGIEPENLEKIFDPFFTTRADGTGLGLSIAYNIVSQHGGHIAVQRNPERGMAFTVTLPLEESPTGPRLSSQRA
jgi:signal transduction histidine kinase